MAKKEPLYPHVPKSKSEGRLGIYQVRLEEFIKAKPEWDRERSEVISRSYHNIRDKYIRASTEDEVRRKVSVPPGFAITHIEGVREESGYYVTSIGKIRKDLVGTVED